MLTTSKNSEPAVAVDDYRHLFQNVPSPVTVVTAMEDGRSHATTVSSFASLSVEPELVMISLDRKSELLRIVERTGRLGINLLAEGQQATGLACASKNPDKLDGIDWQAVDDLPRLGGTAGWLDCEVVQVLEAGDHKILVSKPRRIESYDRPPMMYHRRTFKQVGAALV
jgi:3-hydroxy-9,10-secoandrosta-1,3,5(10)-triene-9,17-dione monooxygenase reductase component